MTNQIKCKNCKEKGTPKNNSSIGYYCEKKDCQLEQLNQRVKEQNDKLNREWNKSREPIMKVSKKLSKERKIYSGKRIIFLAEKPYCEGVIPECTGTATTIHHKKGRIGALLNDETHWVGLCLTCHKFIEEHPLTAKSLGYSEDRL